MNDNSSTGDYDKNKNNSNAFDKIAEQQIADGISNIFSSLFNGNMNSAIPNGIMIGTIENEDPDMSGWTDDDIIIYQYIDRISDPLIQNMCKEIMSDFLQFTTDDGDIINRKGFNRSLFYNIAMNWMLDTLRISIAAAPNFSGDKNQILTAIRNEENQIYRDETLTETSDLMISKRVIDTICKDKSMIEKFLDEDGNLIAKHEPGQIMADMYSYIIQKYYKTIVSNNNNGEGD